MTAQEEYKKWLDEHGCKGVSCDKCVSRYAFSKKTFEFKCVIVEMAIALGIEAGAP